MSYITVAVDIENGRVVPREPEKLPESGTGLLTILESTPAAPSNSSALEAFRRLQRELLLTPETAEAWKTAIRNARR